MENEHVQVFHFNYGNYTCKKSATHHQTTIMLKFCFSKNKTKCTTTHTTFHNFLFTCLTNLSFLQPQEKVQGRITCGHWALPRSTLCAGTCGFQNILQVGWLYRTQENLSYQLVRRKVQRPAAISSSALFIPFPFPPFHFSVLSAHTGWFPCCCWKKVWPGTGHQTIQNKEATWFTCTQ